MKICFVALNAKYIHTSPAVRILNKIVSSKYDSVFFEFTIKDNIDNIINNIKDYDVIGLSCYIWNIEMMIELSKKLKQLYPDKIVFAGGPEVSYDTKYFVNYFDYVMNNPSSSNEWVNITNEEFQKLIRPNSYYNAPNEFFAEAFAYYCMSQENVNGFNNFRKCVKAPHYMSTLIEKYTHD